MVRIENSFFLQDFNTFKIPVKTRYFASFSKVDELAEILDFIHANNLNFFVLGKGANLLFTHDYDGIIIHPVANGITFEGETVIAEAGVVWDDLVKMTVEAGLGGLENLSLIPGTVGAAPVQNIGAYGAEAKDSILWVEYIDALERKKCRIEKSECEFGYRDSVFKHALAGRAVILRVAFKLSHENADYPYRLDYGALKTSVGMPSIAKIRESVIAIRRSKLPDPLEMGNAGSFFRNPEISLERFESLKAAFPDIVSFSLPSGRVKISAGWLIERAGWKGRALGPAAVHDKQALVLVNRGGALGNDVLALCDSVRKDVVKLFGIELQPEVIIL